MTNKFTKYGWWLLVITPFVFAFVVFVNNGYRFDNLNYKTNNPICPDDFTTSEEHLNVFSEWTNNFYDTHPEATLSDFSKARVNFWKENNCTEALKRYNDYITGNVDEETQQNIEKIIAEEMAKNQENSVRNYEDEFYSECEKIQANVWHTECIIENLDRASAIREWKQRKIETLKHPEINTYNFSFLPENIEKMKNWREGFEDSRDKGCIVEWSFRMGSGVPGAIAKCELNYEISALKILDEVYYGTILKDNFGSQGISDFEPKEKDVQKIMKNNKTERGCVWADDSACEYP